MLVTGLMEWDFMSYHPELKPFILTIKADPSFHDKLSGYLALFIKEMSEGLNQLTIK